MVDGQAEELAHFPGQGAEANQVFDPQRVLGEFPDRQGRPLDGQGRDDGVDPGPVLEPGIHHRRAFVDPAPEGRNDPFDHVQDRPVAGKPLAGEKKLAPLFHVDLVLLINHHFGNLGVVQQFLEGPEPQGLVQDILSQFFPGKLRGDGIADFLQDLFQDLPGAGADFRGGFPSEVHPLEVQLFDQLAVEVFPERGDAGMVEAGGGRRPGFRWGRRERGFSFARPGHRDGQHLQDPGADPDLVAGFDLGFRRDLSAVDQRPIGAAEVPDPGLAVPAEDLGVLAGDAGFGNDQGAIRASPDQDFFPGDFPAFRRGAGSAGTDFNNYVHMVIYVFVVCRLIGGF